MTCTSLLLSLLAYPDWPTAFFILFVAACFGASVMCLYYEIRFRRGLWHQKREDEIAKTFRTTQP